jgi:hypothetical protein
MLANDIYFPPTHWQLERVDPNDPNRETANLGHMIQYPSELPKNVFSGHKQIKDPLYEVVLMGHDRQPVIPYPDAYVPDRHILQAVTAVMLENVPGLHEVHDELPFTSE